MKIHVRKPMTLPQMAEWVEDFEKTFVYNENFIPATEKLWTRYDQYSAIIRDAETPTLN